jgi:hypothetical protein
MASSKKSAAASRQAWLFGGALLLVALLARANLQVSPMTDERDVAAPHPEESDGLRESTSPLDNASRTDPAADDKAEPSVEGSLFFPEVDRVHSVVGLPSDPIVLGPPLLRPDPQAYEAAYGDLELEELLQVYLAVDEAFKAEREAEFDRMEQDGRALTVPMPVYDGPDPNLRGKTITANRYSERIVKCWQSIEDRTKLVELVIDPVHRADIYDLEFERNWLLSKVIEMGGFLPAQSY